MIKLKKLSHVFDGAIITGNGSPLALFNLTLSKNCFSSVIRSKVLGAWMAETAILCRINQPLNRKASLALYRAIVHSIADWFIPYFLYRANEITKPDGSQWFLRRYTLFWIQNYSDLEFVVADGSFRGRIVPPKNVYQMFRDLFQSIKIKNKFL